MKELKESYRKLLAGESPAFAIWTLFVCGLFILILSPLILTRPAFSELFILTDKGEIGDAIAGTTVPFLTLIGAFLTFLAFWTQVKANKKQTEQFDKQDDHNRIERFESKFYDMIKIHRENVNELNIEDKLHGKKCFIHLYSELKFCYYHFHKLYNIQLRKGETRELKEDEIFNIAFLTFFFGIGRTTDKAFEDLMKKYDQSLIKEYHKLLSGWQEAYPEKPHISIGDTEDKVYSMSLKYKPFRGHTSRLGHYYRHLFQTAKYVIEQDDKLIKDKYEYIKTLRAQLTNHEQLLLYYNSLSILGQPWNEKKLLSEFRLIKNIPLPYADFSTKPKDKFGRVNSKGDYIFEWDEILERQNSLE